MKKILVGLLFICFFNICSSTKVNAVHLDVQQSRLFNSLLVRVKQRPLQYLKKVQTKEISVNAPLLLTQIFRKNLNDFRLAVDKSNDSTSQCVESGKAISQKREEYGIWSEALLKFESNFIDILNSYFQQERELIAEILRQAEEIQNFSQNMSFEELSTKVNNLNIMIYRLDKLSDKKVVEVRQYVENFTNNSESLIQERVIYKAEELHRRIPVWIAYVENPNIKFSEDRRQALFNELNYLFTVVEDVNSNGNFTTDLTIAPDEIPVLFATFANERPFSCFNPKYEHSPSLFDPKRGPSNDTITNKVLASFFRLITDDGYSKKKGGDENRIVKAKLLYN